jgi:outer membrane protein insertion porin family
LSTSKNRYFLTILSALLLSGCLGTKHLKENEKHLFRQNLNVPEKISKDDLNDLYAQRPNRKFLGLLPIYHLVSIYYRGLKHYDKEKFVQKKERKEKKFDAKIAQATRERRINNLQFRKQKKIDKFNSRIENGNLFMQWGEPIAVYDSSLVQLTIDRFKNHLFSEGYFNNRVTTKTITIGKLVNLTYEIETEAPYRIDTILFNVQDSAVLSIIKRHKSEMLLKIGDRYQDKNRTGERERIDLLLKDYGYFDFSRQYIDFLADTTLRGNKKIAIMLTIHDPKKGRHKQFTLDSIRFTTDSGVPMPGEIRKTRTYRDIQYHYYRDNYNLKILSQRVFLSPGNLYSRTQTFNSQRQLANLDAFKFVNINYDTTGNKFIANIFVSPLDRYEWSHEAGVNVTQGYPGPFYNINLKKRNIFKGLENFELNGRIGLEGVAAATESQKGFDVYVSKEAGINASLIFPQFIWPLRSGAQVRIGKYNPKTRLTLGFSLSNRPEYTRSSYTLSNTYTWQNKRITQYSVALTNISIINSKTVPKFDTLLQELEKQGNYNLARSFSPSFVSSMIFGITWNRNYGNFDKNSVFIRAQFETGGTSLNFIDTTLITKQDLQYFKYLRFNFDYRRNKVLTKWATLAYRVNTGVAYSYGRNKALPYEKFYFAGGSNSVRAWSPRRLGLGSVPPLKSETPKSDGYFDYQFEKPGEILLEGSIELRSNLIGFIDGAIFLDAGNVWSFQKPRPAFDTEGNPIPEVGNSQFKVNSFYKEIGVGTGFGLRFDFTFLILRLDVGIKVYDPARAASDRFVLDKVKFWAPYAREENETYTNFREPVIYNVGIGYPF